ncbi:MAG: hypothetical protein QNK37_38390 [Acidobacteriota bacterium]|nr:hypothetical protein [Acidobacteriota bacterium]
MARLKPILANAVKGVRRRSVTSMRGMGPVLFLLLAFQMWPVFQADVQAAAFSIQLGESERAVRLFRYLFIGWLFLPMLLKSGGLDRAELLKLQRFPLRRRHYFIIGLVDVLANPLFLSLLVLTLAAYPIIAAAPASGTALISFGLFVWGAMMFMLLLHDLILIIANSPLWQRRLPLIPIPVAATVWLLQLPALAPLIRRMSDLLPDRLLIKTLLGDTTAAVVLFLLALVATFGMVLSFATLIRVLGRETGKDRKAGMDIKRRLIPAARTPAQALVRQSLIQIYSGFEPYLAWLVAAGNAAYLLTAPDAEGAALFMGLTLVSFCHTPLAWNQFGHDGGGFLRMLTWPVLGRDLMRTRNLGLALAASLPLFPIILAGGYRFGPVSLLCGLLHAVNLILCLLLQGNFLSLRKPARRFFLPSGHGVPGMPNLLVAAGYGLFTFLWSLLAWRENPWQALILQFVLSLILSMLWRRSISRGGKHLEAEGPVLALQLAGG